ncbi:unnamed protein product [Moneuplotes crassus]|uniref:Citrate synthase n=1 Tax=Euplotes crassus TaxID=5936 RepID=A0AAD1UDW6_EUPCR|nr:unnamed protein product [Moneuplotes crassus]
MFSVRRAAIRMRAMPTENILHMIPSRTFAIHKLKGKLAEIIPEVQGRLNTLKKEHGTKILQTVNVNQVIQGMKGIKGVIYETSEIYPTEGVKYRGYSIDEIVKMTPSFVEGGSPAPEGVLWLFLSGEYPTKEEFDDFVLDLKERSYIPDETIEFIRSFPKNMSPMTQFSMGMLACQNMSTFAQNCENGIAKDKHWEAIYDDCINVVAKSSKVAALVFNNLYNDNKDLPDFMDDKLDFGAKYAHMLGYDSEDMYELMRLYLVLHMDHGGGSAGAHTNKLVGSVLSDPYLSFSASLSTIAGPLHGLGSQNCLKWYLEIVDKYGENWTKDDIVEHVHYTLNNKRVVPGYGHSVVRMADPRFIHQLKFGLTHFPNDNLIKLVNACYEVIPDLLPKIKSTISSPYPNLVACSGALLMHFGMDQLDYYTVLFGVSRSFGYMSSLLWDRALGLPMERPGSFTVKGLLETAKTIE